MSSIEIRWHEGPRAVGDLVPLLAAEGLLPPPMFAMDPAYLAAGLEGDCPAILVACRGQRPVAFMSVALRRARFAYRLGPLTLARPPYRQLRMLGCRFAEAGDREALDALLAYMTGPLRRRYDVALVAELPVDDPLAVCLASPPLWLRREMDIDRREMDSYRVRIEGTFESYLQARMSGKTRNTLRRKLRMFEESAAGPVAVRVYTSPEQTDEFVRQASRVARHTYQARRGHESVADTQEMRKKLSYFAECGTLRSYVLFAGDEPCAYCYGIIYRRSYLYEIPGYDERMASKSPGAVLLYRMLEDLFAGGLVDELDFGAGAAEYKRIYATSNPSVLYANLYLRRPYPRLLRVLDRGCTSLSNVAKPWAARLRGKSPRPAGKTAESSPNKRADETPIASRE